MAAVTGENNGLAPFGNLGSRSTLKSEMTHDLALAIARDHWDEFASLVITHALARAWFG